MLLEYSIIAHDEDEIALLGFVRENKIQGYVYPNVPGGALFKLMLDKKVATLLSLKFRLKVCGKSESKPVIKI